MRLNWKIWLLIIVIALSILAISPSFESGVVVKYVEKDSASYQEGLRAGEVIKKINGIEIKNREDYSLAVNSIVLNPEGTRIDIVTKQNSYILFTNETPKITVEDISRTRIKTGLDLRGGARALVQADVPITDSELNDLIEISRNRFNVFGLSDVQIKGVSDLSGDKFMLVEVAGATPGDLEKLIAQQGKFEAKIGNETVFTGGREDIGDVCRNKAECAGVTDCRQVEGGYACSFRFTLFLTPQAAERHAKITGNISLDDSGRYLSEKLFLYVDEQEVDSLLVGADLKGRVATEISIQGSGEGITREEAFNDAKASMNKLQTILITGSLPYKLNIVKLDTISASLGDEFTFWILIAGASAIILVGIIVFVRYRKIKSSLAVLATAFSEIIIILGVAALINWNLDLPSIAGILATIGTGVDQQIVILDEARTGKTLSIKERMKRALFVVFSAYLTSLVSLLPLYWAGAGLFKGFAITTIIGITAGVFITRPAFSEIIKKIEE